MNKAEKDIKQTLALFQSAYPLFKGVKSEVIGNVLAKLIAGWLMGYRSKDEESTNRLRFEIIATLMMSVSEMVQDLNNRKTDRLH